MSTPEQQAKAHADLLISTGMAYEITPSTIAYRAFLDGFTAGAAKHPDTERLNWLEENRAQINYTSGSGPHLAHVSTPKTYGESGETIRAAIDAAMKERP